MLKFAGYLPIVLYNDILEDIIMGANQFQNTGYADTAKQAFTDIVSESLYMNGHGGYSGTIAEKHEFRMKQVEPVTWEEAEELIENDEEFDDKWGPAGCLELKTEGNKRLWLFFGWASS